MERVTRLSIFCIALLLIAAALPSRAAPNLPAQRVLFKSAEQALKQGKLSTFKQLQVDLKNYPLAPYLRFAALRKELRKATPEQVQRFIQQTADTPLAERMRVFWLSELARRGQWNTFLDFYQGSRSAKRQCQAATAFIRTGRHSEAWPLARQLWLHGKSRPKACDPVFASWRKSGHFSADLVWRRFALAMNKRQLRLARYLRRDLNQRDRAWADLWLLADAKPGKALQDQRLHAAHAYRENIIVHALTQLAKQDTRAALARWRRWSAKVNFNAGNKQRFSSRVLSTLRAADAPADAVQLADKLPIGATDERNHERRLRVALRAQDWAQLLDWFGQAPAAVQAKSAWRYWHATALKHNGHRGKAGALLQALAGERSYYAFLAADELGLEYQMSHETLDLDPALRTELESAPVFARVRELLALDRNLDARREWRDWIATMNPQQKSGTAVLASELGWHRQVVLTLASAEAWDDLQLRFPVVQHQLIAKHAQNRSLEPDWVLGLIRQESAFSPTVRSPAGAVGLMQLMPGTARQVARHLKLRRPRRNDLHNPTLNVRLGTTYLKQMLDRFDGNRTLATAAYNAGPSNVNRWLPPQGELPAPVWVELIPYRETRTYVQRVFAYAAIYRAHLGIAAKPISDWLQPVRS